MDFFQKHDKALRKGRLLQAASALYPMMVENEILNPKSSAVDRAFELEWEIEQRLKKEEKSET